MNQTPELHMKTVYVGVEKRRRLMPWKFKVVIEQWRQVTSKWVYKGHELPVGFKWNGSSSPWWARSIISPWEHPKASGCHDFSCERAAYYMRKYQELKDDQPGAAAVYKLRAIETREEADREYGRMVGNSDGKIKQIIAHGAVRVGSFGGAGW